MGAHSGDRKWLGLWVRHSGRHSDSPILESEYPEPTEHESEYTARHADRIHIDPVTEILPEHRHRRSRLWGSIALIAAVAIALVSAYLIRATTGPGTPPSLADRAPAAVSPSPHDEPSDVPVNGAERTPEPTAAASRPVATPTAVPSPQGTRTVTVTPSGPAPAPVRPSGPVPTVTTTQTVTQPAAAPEPQPTVTVTRTVRATETRYLPRPRVTVTITVSVPSLLP
jgi:cytoskeletal protein RodZ